MKTFNMKNLLTKIGALAIHGAASASMIPSALAINEDEILCEDANLTAEQKLQCLLNSEEFLIESSPQGQSTSTSLPQGDLFQDFLPFFINTGLSIAGTLIFLAIVYAGYMMVTANDKEEEIEKAKKILIFAMVGVAIIATSYALIYGIANLDLD